MTLSETQLRFFHTFGYLVCRQLFQQDEVEWISSEFDHAIQTQGGGDRHDGTRRTFMLGPIDRTEKLCTLLDHPGVIGVASGALGDDFNYASGDGNYYSGDTGWHPDGNWGELFACKIAIYLDKVTRDTGCLRVIPGSQRPDHFVRADKIDPNRSMELFGVMPSEFPGNEALESDPGDLVIFNHDTYHAAFGGGTRRRMFTMNLTRGWHTERDRELFQSYVSTHTAGGYKVELGAGMYSHTMLNTASESRWVHLRQGKEMHDHLFPDMAGYTE